MNTPIIPFYQQEDKVLVKSEGCYAFDADGIQYLDFESGDWAAGLGHSHPRINKIIKQQADKLIHDGLRFRNMEAEQLSLLLSQKLGLDNGKCTFLNSGSEAVNLGITLAKHLSKRSKILKIDCTYLSAYGFGKISDENTDLIDIPIDQTDAISNINFNDIAVFVFEPGNSSGLIKYPNPTFIEAVADQIKKHGGLLMSNEVTTGFGRTGKWFGFQHYNFTPDIVAVGKALGNGYPVSGIAVSESTAKSFEENPFRYAQSHQNDALGCAIGIEVIKTIKEEKLITQCQQTGKYFNEKLLELKAQHPNIVTAVRARGLMIALELQTENLTAHTYNKLIEHGFLVGHKQNVLRFMPPLIIENNDIDNLITTIANIFKQL